MSCPLCQQRKPRRACPARGDAICTVCCATKRLVEIDCPPDCAHLAAAREHPAAVVRRQQAADFALLLPAIRDLTERQHQLLFIFLTLIARYKPEGFGARLLDADISDAAAALASTLETAARGVIYEHTPQSLPAQRLAQELKGLLAEMRQQGGTIFDREAAIVLRAIEKGARDTAAAAAGSSELTYLALIGRLLQVNRAGSQVAGPPKPASPLILP